MVENAFGHIANRFRILRKCIELSPEKAIKVVLAICVLHNFLLSRNSIIYAHQDSFDNEQDGVVENANWWQEGLSSETMFPLQQLQPQNYSHNCKEIRSEFTEYFTSAIGEVPWQYKYI